MSPLLVLTGVLVIAAGLLSVRTSARIREGVPVAGLIQSVVGAVVCVLGFRSSPDGRGGFLVVVASVLLVLVSATRQWAHVGAARRRREASEGARLQTYVKYLSRDVSRD